MAANSSGKHDPRTGLVKIAGTHHSKKCKYAFQKRGNGPLCLTVLKMSVSNSKKGILFKLIELYPIIFFRRLPYDVQK